MTVKSDLMPYSPYLPQFHPPIFDLIIIRPVDFVEEHPSEEVLAKTSVTLARSAQRLTQKRLELQHDSQLLEVEEPLKPRRSAIKSLPCELLQEIFIFAVFPIFKDGFCIQYNYETPCKQTRCVLSTICRQWRVIVLDTRAIWANIFIKAGEVDDKSLELVKTCLNRAKAPCLLDITFRLLEEATTRSALLKTTLALLVKEAYRWRSFDCTIPTYNESLILLNLPDNFPRLQKIRLGLPRWPEDAERQLWTRILAASPQLKLMRSGRFDPVELYNGSQPVEVIGLACQRMTDVHLRIHPPQAIFRDLSLFRHVRHLSIGEWGLFHKLTGDESNTKALPIKLLCLESLRYHVSQLDMVEYLTRMTTPSLKELRIFNGEIEPGMILDFLDRSDCELQNLQLQARKSSLEILLPHPRLSGVNMFHLGLDGKCRLAEDALTTFSPTSNGDIPLPSLKMLCLRGSFIADGLISEMLEGSGQILRYLS